MNHDPDHHGSEPALVGTQGAPGGSRSTGIRLGCPPLQSGGQPRLNATNGLVKSAIQPMPTQMPAHLRRVIVNCPCPALPQAPVEIHGCD